MREERKEEKGKKKKEKREDRREGGRGEGRRKMRVGVVGVLRRTVGVQEASKRREEKK